MSLNELNTKKTSSNNKKLQRQITNLGLDLYHIQQRIVIENTVVEDEDLEFFGLLYKLFSLTFKIITDEVQQKEQEANKTLQSHNGPKRAQALKTVAGSDEKNQSGEA